ncbi:MAG: ABC-2 transporter permease [Treponema sp.]|nr:ABC-2 transporter permease [Treponema sp.]
MKNLNLLKKEFRLGNNLSVLIWICCSFLMQIIPSYPMYVGPYYCCLCIMLSFALNQTSHDILYTVLLPVKKIDTVKARFMYACILECISLFMSIILGIVKMLVKFPENNAGIDLNVAFLGLQMFCFSVFNFIYLGGVYKNPIKSGIRFLFASLAYFAAYVLCEFPLWKFKGYKASLLAAGYKAFDIKVAIDNLSWFRIPKIGYLFLQNDPLSLIKQLPVFACGLVIFVLVWLITYKRAAKQFERYEI